MRKIKDFTKDITNTVIEIKETSDTKLEFVKPGEPIKEYMVDWDKVKTIEDLKLIFASVNLMFYPAKGEYGFQKAFDAGLLKEKL